MTRRFAGLSPIDFLNFALTNAIPRRTATRVVGWISRLENPIVRDVSLTVFRVFCAPDLSEARKTEFTSLRDCFIRELAPGTRPIDARPDVLISPCDGFVIAAGRVESGQLLQVKGSRYRLDDLVRDAELAARYEGGCFVTLRLTAGMYHRFHAPLDGRIVRVTHISGDVFNVNPPTLARIPRLYCRNERAVVHLAPSSGWPNVLLIPVAAVLVAGLRLHAASLPSDRCHPEPWSCTCDAAVQRGEELGWFEHGSTIIVLTPPSFRPADGVSPGALRRMGQALLHAGG